MALLSVPRFTIVLCFITSMVMFGIGPLPATGLEFRVGGSGGWMEPTGNDTDIYNDWASRKRFHVADSLYFGYTNDSVPVVDEESYEHCIVSSPKKKFKDGHTTFTFDRYGSFYFISGNTTHCRHGQRLIVRVMHHNPSPPPSPAPESGGDDGGSTTPPPSSSFPPPGAAPNSGPSPLLLAVTGLALAAVVSSVVTTVML